MKIKFGMYVWQEGLSFDTLKRYFTDFENLGFFSAFIYDHFHPIYSPHEAPVLENWVLLSALAASTRKIRLGTLVNCNSYRHPSVLAKMAASFDVISGGRLEFMLGAGWFDSEYNGYGIPFPPARVRIEQMKEAIQVIKLMWTKHKAHFKGKHYNLNGALCYPKPLQKPYPRIWVGGSGEKLTLKTIAEVGEGTNFGGQLRDFERKLGILNKYCEKVGRDYSSIEKSWLGDLIIGSSEEEVSQEYKRRRRTIHDISNEDPRNTALIGTSQDIIKQIERLMEFGVSYLTIRLVSTSLDFMSKKSINLLSEVMSSFK